VRSDRPLRVALTGGIATGKSYCLRKFAELGAVTVDADVLAHEALGPGTPGLAAVASRFGSGVLLSDGSLDRAALGRIVFGDELARKSLEAIVHPQVYAEIERRYRELGGRRSRGRRSPVENTSDPVTSDPVFLADIPLLYETGRESDFDRIVVAACRPEQQLERMLKRGMTADDARARLASQLPIEEKRRRADYVIDTSGATAETDRQIQEIFLKLRDSDVQP
jgi:dephospho-CoA kinase